MGELVVNASFGDWEEDDGAGGTQTVYGAMWGKGSTGDHHCSLLTSAQATTYAANAVSSSSLNDWVTNYLPNGAFKTWLVAQPLIARLGIWKKARRY